MINLHKADIKSKDNELFDIKISAVSFKPKTGCMIKMMTVMIMIMIIVSA